MSSDARDKFIAANPILDVLEQHGVKVTGGGKQRMAKCPWHKDGKESFSVNVSEGTFYCHACAIGGSVIDFLARQQGIEPGDWCRKELPQWENRPVAPQRHPGPRKPSVQPETSKPEPSPRGEPVEFYDYRSATGELLYQVCRFEPKNFRQRRPDGKGGWIWNMDGVERVPYCLPSILNAKTRAVWIVEGEKDCRTLMKLGWIATTNVGGAKKWVAGYGEFFKGKDVILCGDNDDPGREHMKVVHESLRGKAASIRQVNIPKGKDISDFVESFASEDEQKSAVVGLFEGAVPLDGAVDVGLLSMEEAEAIYVKYVRTSKEQILDLSKWLPSLRRVRPLQPGDVITILGATGTGKTNILHNMAVAASPLPTILVELELPIPKTVERLLAISEKMRGEDVEATYMAGGSVGWKNTGAINHIFINKKARLTIEALDALISQAELKMGVPPKFLEVDYIQLLRGKGKRYDIISDAAEELKQIAIDRQIVIALASQVKRKDGDAGMEITLSDAKESGAIENSSGLVIGAWRPNRETMHIRILKNTNGTTHRKSEHIVCNFDGATSTITERVEEMPMI